MCRDLSGDGLHRASVPGIQRSVWPAADAPRLRAAGAPAGNSPAAGGAQRSRRSAFSGAGDARQQPRQRLVGGMRFEQQVEIAQQRRGSLPAPAALPRTARIACCRATVRKRSSASAGSAMPESAGNQMLTPSVAGIAPCTRGRSLPLKGLREQGGACRRLGHPQTAGAAEHGGDQQVEALRDVGQRETWARRARWRGAGATGPARTPSRAAPHR